MALLYFRKSPGGILVPAHESDHEAMQKYRNGEYLKCDIKKQRNRKFHNKFFVLLNFGFKYWDPPKHQVGGFTSQKVFDRFRHDIIVAAGYYDVVSTLDGDVILRAKSISFDSMEEDDFNKLYKSVYGAIWDRVVSLVHNMTEREMDNALNHLMSLE